MGGRKGGWGNEIKKLEGGGRRKSNEEQTRKKRPETPAGLILVSFRFCFCFSGCGCCYPSIIVQVNAGHLHAQSVTCLNVSHDCLYELKLVIIISIVMVVVVVVVVVAAAAAVVVAVFDC